MKLEEFEAFISDKKTRITKVTIERNDGKKLEVKIRDLLNYSELWEKLAKGVKKNESGSNSSNR